MGKKIIKFNALVHCSPGQQSHTTQNAGKKVFTLLVCLYDALREIITVS